MEHGATDETSPDVSISGFAGAENTSNFIEIDVESALRELAGGHAPHPVSGARSSTTGSSTSQAPEPGGDGDAAAAAASEDQGEGSDAGKEGQGDRAPSRESSDSDVIHIDITQRPPPLPLSGMALEQIVAMLPGSTYAVTGSGTPLRASPRPEEPLERSKPSQPDGSSAEVPSVDNPSDDASSESCSEGSAADDGDPNAPPGEEHPPEWISGPGAKGAANGGGGSPRMALTFIPGLGLVPVVIHDVLDEEEEEGEEDGAAGGPVQDAGDGDADTNMGIGDDDVQVGGVGMGVLVEGEHSKGSGAGDEPQPDATAVATAGVENIPMNSGDDSDDVEAVAEAFAAHSDGRGNDGDGDDVLGGRGAAVGPQAATAAADPSVGEAALGDAAAVDKAAGPKAAAAAAAAAHAKVPQGACVPSAADAGGSGLGADTGEPGQVDDVSGGRYDISEEQLRDIIQQAVRGLEFGEMALEVEAAEDDEGGEDEQEEELLASAQQQHSSEEPMSEGDDDRLEGAGASPGGLSSSSPGAADMDSLTAFMEGHYGITTVYAPPGFTGGATTATAATDSEDSDDGADGKEASGDPEDDVVGEDEVDDSGSGGVPDESNCILGGLSQRFSRPAADGVVLRASSPGMLQAAEHAKAAGSVAADDGRETGGRSGERALEPVRAASGSDDASVMASRLQPQSAVAPGLQLPRSRYMAHNAMHSYDGAPPFSGHGKDAAPGATSGEGLTGLEGKAEPRMGVPAAAGAVAAPAKPDQTLAHDLPDSAVGSAGLAAKAVRDRGADASGSFPTPFGGDTLAIGTSGSGGGGSAGGGGSDLNSTMRTSSKSLAAIRDAALQAEAQRQAKFMAERLGGGADHAAKAAESAASSAEQQPQEPPQGTVPSTTAPRTGASSIINPFGCAGHQASAAAGLIDIDHDGGGSSTHRGGRRGGGAGGSSSTGYANVDGAIQAKRHVASDETDGDLEDLLRDRAIIQPRYPTDSKPNHHHHHHHHHHGRHDDAAALRTQPGEDSEALGGSGSGDPAGATAEGDGSSGAGGWKPRHRRSMELVDLDKIANGDGEDGSPPTSPGKGSGTGNSPTSPPARSLLATRKSDDGMLFAPEVSRSPRLEEDDIPVDSSSSSSSSAHSVADERLVDELEVLREELGQKTTLVAGLRGELRKYTELAMRLEHQLAELRHQHATGDAGSGGGARADARNRSQSETGLRQPPALLSAVAAIGVVPPQEQLPDDTGAAEGRADSCTGTSAPVPSSTQPQPQPHPQPLPGPPGSHALPPHPQAQGLEGPARLTLYREILSQAQLHVGRSGGPAPPDLRDANDLLQGKDTLDAGTEKVLLIKLQKMVTWGCEAALKAAAAQSLKRFMEVRRRLMEAAAQQAAEEKSAWEAERTQLKQALEAARSAAAPASAGAGGDAVAGAEGQSQGEGLERELEAARDELEASRAQVSDLECAVASLNADVRKLRVQLRSSRDGSGGSLAGAAEQPEAHRISGGGGVDPALASRADSMAWKMERQMLLKTISGLERELGEARAAHDGGLGSPGKQGGGDGDAAAAAKKAALAEAALERVQQLQTERDAAAAENVELRRQIREAVLAATATAAATAVRDGGAGQGDGFAEGEQGSPGAQAEVQQLQAELVAAREALAKLAAESQAEVEAHEEQCDLLRTQVAELRRELAMSAADAAAAAGRLGEEKDALEAAASDRDALVARLEQQLLAAEAEMQGLRAALEEQAAMIASLERLQERSGRGGAARFDDEAQDSQAAAGTDPVHTTHGFEASESQLRMQEATATIQALSEALKLATADRDRLQQLADAKSQQLSATEAHLADVSAAVAQLQAEATEMQAQVGKLQALLERVQRDKEAAQAAAEAAREEAEAAEERAGDAHAASLLAESALGRALEEVEALTNRVGALEDEAEQAQEDAAAAQDRLRAAEAELGRARAEAEELRVYVSELEGEARDLRTALAAEDTVQVQLRGQVESLESELETQASLAQIRGQRAAEVEAALAAAEVRQAAAAEAEAARGAATAAASQVAELEAQLAELQSQLAEALRQGEEAAGRAEDLEQQLAEAEELRQQAEEQLQDALARADADAPNQELSSTAPAKLQSQPPGGADGRDAAHVLAESRLAALEDQLRAAERDREAMQREVAGLLKQLGASAQQQLMATAQQAREQQQHQQQQPESARGADGGAEAAALRAERALLVADCARLQAELERLRAGDAANNGKGSGGAAAQARRQALSASSGPGAGTGGENLVPRTELDALQEQLRGAQSELQALRGELRAARVELAAKAELLAAKDGSLGSLQDSVDALKLALQVTQQSLQAPMLSPRSPAQPFAASEGPFPAEKQMPTQQYHDSVATLQSKVEVSESTIRRLEKQVAALETRLTPDDKGSGVHRAARSSDDVAADSTVVELRLQLEEKKEENARLLQELELARKQLSANARQGTDSATAASSASGSSGTGGAGEAGISAAALNDLQMQILQWRALGEDVHARYQSKKEAVRRLREQLAAEQQRHADEQARSKAQLEAACQRLGRLATELGAALRRCVSLDLQPLSATTLTTSPRSQLGGVDAPEDINTLAALLARQGAALIESLELALDQVTGAREERALLLAQLAHRQVVLDELRHHVARQAAVATAASPDLGASASPGGAAGGGVFASTSAVTTWPSQAPPQAGSQTAARAADGRQAPSVPPAGASGVQAPAASAAHDLPTRTGPATTASPSKSLHIASMNLAQDMAALSVQQAGLRSTLHHFEQQRQSQQGKPRSLSAVPGLSPAGYSGAVSPALRTTARRGNGGLSADGLGASASSPAAAAAVAVTASSGAMGAVGAGLGTMFGQLSSVRTVAGPFGGVPLSRPLVAGLYQQPTSPAGALASPLNDAGRLPDGLQASPYAPMPRSPGSQLAGVSGPSATTVAGPTGASTIAQGGSTGLSLSHERRLKLGDTGL